MMAFETIKHFMGYVMILLSYLYNQISDAAGGVIDQGLDAGLSVGLLILGLMILGWYHWRYQEYSREVIRKLASQKDERTEDFHELAEQQIRLSKDQIQTNKELTQAVKELSRNISS